MNLPLYTGLLLQHIHERMPAGLAVSFLCSASGQLNIQSIPIFRREGLVVGPTSDVLPRLTWKFWWLTGRPDSRGSMFWRMNTVNRTTQNETFVVSGYNVGSNRFISIELIPRRNRLGRMHSMQISGTDRAFRARAGFSWIRSSRADSRMW